MSESIPPQLFQYLDEQFGVVKTEISTVKAGVQTLQTSVDGLTKLVRDFQDEHILLRRKVELLENWAKEVSKKVGIPLPQGLLSD